MSENKHEPYVPNDVVMPEFTPSALIAGTLLGIVFGASSLYLVLKVGMTVSASIPVAVLSITLFRWLGSAFGIRKATILENNIVQTAGSAGESIAFGVGVTMPALMLIGFEMDWARVLVVSVLGGLLGILMMIPLRRAFIVKLHGKPGEEGKLLYPEGTACAQVLISGDKGGATSNTVFLGFGVAFLHKVLTEGFKVLIETAAIPLKLGATATDAFSRVASVTNAMASELLGVGYIIGIRTSAIMMGGAVLGSLVLAPSIAILGPGDLTFGAIRSGYLTTIGAGCVAAAGIISMCRTLPMIVRSFASGLSSLRGTQEKDWDHLSRTERDMPPAFVLGGNLLLLVLLAVFLMREVHFSYAALGAFLVLGFGFLFVTVSSRLTGEIGSSSNPISGMTVATLLMTCLIFLSLGMTSPSEAVLALCIGGVVCIAASNGGTTSQDLKTGFLVGATPVWQQWAILVGALTSSLVIGGTLLAFNAVGIVHSQRNLPRIDLSSELPKLTEMEEYQNETFHVWRLSTQQELPGPFGSKIKVKAGKFLVDSAGQVVYRVDPTITGELKKRDNWTATTDLKVKLTKSEIAKLKNAVTMRFPVDKKLVAYRVWRNSKEASEAAKKSDKVEVRDAAEPYYAEIPEKEYLVNNEGNVAFVNDPTAVNMKFEAPKTQVMGIIINGLLNNNLNWMLVAIGAFIAITLELCGISSLAFAVGLYIPMAYSTPIFLGGIVRWIVETIQARRIQSEVAEIKDPQARAEAEVKALAESESSPAVLLASGLIAGGSLGGVLLAFLNFLPEALQKSYDFSEQAAHALGGSAEDPNVTQQLLAFAIFLAIAALLPLVGLRRTPEENTKK